MVDIFQEVEEDLRQERYARLWKNYGGYVIGVAVAIVLGTAGWTGWREYQNSQREAAAAVFSTALNALEADRLDLSRARLGDLIEDGTADYPILARLVEGEALVRAGDIEGAARAYDGVAEDTDADPVFRDLARLLYGLTLLDREDAGTLAAKIQPLTADENPWRHSAREILALAALRAGDRAAAREWLTALSDDDSTPAGIRARATELLAGLGD